MLLRFPAGAGLVPFLALIASVARPVRAADPPAPEALVPVEISLFASEPEIVTPVGVAVDGSGRVFVVENHTHQVQPDYRGPKSDRIRILEDTDKDGRADRITTFADGFTSAMNLAFDDQDVLHLVHRNAVVRLEDNNRDGVCDRQVPLLEWDTETTYPHNGLSGIAFGPDGWIWVGSGENFGKSYTAKGADGTTLTIVPGGANVFRIRRDGSQLERVASGMWNLFALTVDGAGRVLGVDNDPDSRPPCRLLDIVPRADFGYQFQFGRSGLHPFVCWDGELPGTLPAITGTGEAPTGILDLRHAGENAGTVGPGTSLLVTEWGDSTVSRYHLEARGASVGATREVVLRGGTSFRPACLAAAPDGSIFLTDWADREYSVHGKGRIWKLRFGKSATPAGERILPLSDKEKQRKELIGLRTAADAPRLLQALTSDDPFLRNAAGYALARPVFRRNVLAASQSARPESRLGALLVLRRTAEPGSEEMARRFLSDPDPMVRRMAIQWIGERQWRSLRQSVEKSLTGVTVSPALLGGWLAALDLLDRDSPPVAESPAMIQDARILALVDDPSFPEATRAAAIPLLQKPTSIEAVPVLLRVLRAGSPAITRGAVRALAGASGDDLTEVLLHLARTPEVDANLRLDAISALRNRGNQTAEKLLPLLTDSSPAVIREAVRTLRSAIGHPPVRDDLTRLASQSGVDPEVAAQTCLALGLPSPTPRPATDADWLAQIETGGDPASGRRVFFSAAALCSACHRAEGLGVTVGPDLSTIGNSHHRTRLIQSILTPSNEIGPLFGLRIAHLTDGSTVSGVLAAKDGGGNLALVQTGGIVTYAPRDRIVRVDEPPVSVMPEGLEAALTVQDFRDLIAYLESLR